MSSPLIRLAVLLSLIQSINCSQQDRLIAGVKACKWLPWSKNFNATYDKIEAQLVQAKVPIENADQLYAFISAEISLLKIDNCIPVRKFNELISILTQLYMTKDLGTRNCLDHCTYILAKMNCDAGYYKHACLPRSKEKSYIKSIVDRQVFPLIDRCQVPLIEEALDLNATIIPYKVNKVVATLADELAAFRPTRLWTNFREMILATTKPNFLIRRTILRNKNSFLDNILGVMGRLERYVGRYGFNSAIALRSLTPGLVESHYQRLILDPCREYINIMLKIMDPAIFYGSIADMDRSRFNFSTKVSDEKKVDFYRLVKRYYTCMFFDEGQFKLDWTETIMKLFF